MSVKAFELVPAVQRDQLMGDQARVSVECVECCGKQLYVGTTDCLVHHFLLEEVPSKATGRIQYSARKLQQKHLGLKRPVAELRAASALQRLMVLSDGVLFLVDMATLEAVPSASAGAGGAKIKGVTSFCMNGNPVNADPFCVEIAVISSRRRTVQVFTVFRDRVQLVKEVTTAEQPSVVSLDGYFLCLALASQYMILNYTTGASQDLFPYNSEERRPIVKRIGREEFLLAAPGGLGMFANAEGVSQRAPVHWSESVMGAAVCFPYVVALDQDFVSVHSMLDQQLKQSLAFRDGHILQDFEDRVEEALVLTEGAEPNIPRDRFQILHRRILQQAGFIQFGQLQFQEAQEYFRKGELDPRELMSLYPLLLPSSPSFTRCHPPLHPFADLHQLAQGDLVKVLHCKRFLVSYLGKVRGTEASRVCRTEVDTALLKLYAELDHKSLLDLLASDNSCLLADGAPWLEKPGKYFALGLLYRCHGQDSAALQVWTRVVDGELQDPTRPDLYEYIVDFLTFCADLDLVWRYSDWALRRDPKVGIQIFTKRSAGKDQSGQPKPDDVIAYLEKHCHARRLYLEHLVLERRIQFTAAVGPSPDSLTCGSTTTTVGLIPKEAFHSLLAVLYLDQVMSLLGASPPAPPDLLSQARDSLQALLRESNLYSVQLLLDKVQGCDQLLLECATLYGKLEDHGKALDILVHRLRDYASAEAYCLWASASSRDPACRRRLLHLLLDLYLGGAVERRGDLEMATVDLLNRHGDQFDAVRVLSVLPEGWSLQLLRPFLGGALRASIHASRTSRLALGLSRAENLQLLHDRLKERRGPVVVSERRGCPLCHNTFSCPEVVCLPGGIPVHTHCIAHRLSDFAPDKHSTQNSNRT
ncbi:hypothetical protein NHX12_006162 [Muraenolepis orangiensis]|uniref:CNH domain-containing protein n=1 Tax=Muraenolepis orangiensis TaxID=630683 RepID=A0A9Q0DSX3_9TELE|nr:hypothetical protein NHX12_006162 [Muraenolepis orangiensis]